MKLYTQKYIPEFYTSLDPMAEIEGFPVRPGLFDVHGAMELPGGVNFTVHTHYGTACTLLLFHKGCSEPYARLPFPEAYKIGDVYSMIVFGLNIEEFEYAYQVDGPYEPKNGLTFDSDAVLLDPYARSVAGQRVWGSKKSGSYHARVIKDTFDWGDMPQSTRTMSDLIIYELHVRGFTYHPSSGVTHRGTFAGLMEKIPYLKELGINAVELMPIFEFDETMNARSVDGEQLLDYWGYNTVGFFAPNTSYLSGTDTHQEGTELKVLIKTLHDNGIEVILDVVFNHTAEGNEKGPTFCFKGFDNKVYYMLTPNGNYYNFSGCGNTLNCNNPIVRQLILECLRYWTVNYRIDGFRFDLASILGRHEDGSPMNNPPLLELLATDPILRNIKLIAEAWDAGGLYQVGKFPASKRWAEWNGRYRDSLRAFLKGDYWHSWEAAWSISGSGDLYGGFYSNNNNNYAGYNSCVNFLTCHDGFTLYDLYSYNEKHNEKNGWNNTDGANDNNSWNCGVEGETDNPEVLNLRRRMIRNAFAILMCSRGIPMFLAGDEFCNTQYGNNNAYCQDNITSWLDWSLLEKNQDMFRFFQYMIRFRKEHRLLRIDVSGGACGFPDISFHGVEPWHDKFADYEHYVGVMFAGQDKHSGPQVIYIASNAYWEDITVTLPSLPISMCWEVAVDTWQSEQSTYPLDSDKLLIRARSVIVLVGE